MPERKHNPGFPDDGRGKGTVQRLRRTDRCFHGARIYSRIEVL